MSRTVTLRPHHPRCRAEDPNVRLPFPGHDAERCCYCASLIRVALGHPEDPVDYRYGGPKCGCGPIDDDDEDDEL